MKLITPSERFCIVMDAEGKAHTARHLTQRKAKDVAKKLTSATEVSHYVMVAKYVTAADRPIQKEKRKGVPRMDNPPPPPKKRSVTLFIKDPRGCPHDQGFEVGHTITCKRCRESLT